jgi:hypothetical protein
MLLRKTSVNPTRLAKTVYGYGCAKMWLRNSCESVSSMMSVSAMLIRAGTTARGMAEPATW